MLSFLTLSIGIAFIYLTGFLISRMLPAAFLADDRLERHFERAMIGGLLNGWLALTLAQLGVFSAPLHFAIIVVLGGAAQLSARRGAPTTSEPSPSRLHRPGLATLGLSATLALFGFLVAQPFETIIGVRDAGVYANGGFAMARSGALIQVDPLIAQIAADQQSADTELAEAAKQAETNFLGTQNPQRFIATRLRAAGFFINQDELDDGRVVPQGLHLFTAWIGLLSGYFGLAGGMQAPGALGLLGVWSVAMLGRRLAGPWVGLLAALFLALNAVQVWFSRYSTAETTAQFLVFSGLYAFSAAMQSTPANPRRAAYLGLLAGLAFGQLALARIEFFLVIGPLALYLLYSWMARRWTPSHNAILGGAGLMLLHAGIQIAQISRAYFFDTLFARLQDYALTAAVALPFLTPALRQVYLLRPCSRLTMQPCPPVAGMPPTTDAPWNWQRIGLESFVIAIVIIALIVAWRLNLPARIEPLLRRIEQPIRIGVLAAVLGLGGYAYLIRPQILSVSTLGALPGCLTPAQLTAPQGECLRLQGYIGAPIAIPAYVDPLAAWLDRAIGVLRGRTTPALDQCITLRRDLLPPTAAGYTTPELIRDGLLDQTALTPETLATLHACDRYVLRDLFGNAQASLVRVGWYFSPLGITLAVIGLAVLARRAGAASWLFLAVAAIASVVFLRLTYGASDQHYIYILRRYIPHVYPAFAIGAAYAVVAAGAWVRALTARRLEGKLDAQSKAGRFHPSALLPLGLALALIMFLAVTGRPLFRHVEYAGALDQIGAIATRFDNGDILLLRGGAPAYAQSRDIPDLLATPLSFAFGVDSFALKSRDPGRYAPQLARYIRRWQEQGRDVYLALSASGSFALPGMRLEPVGRLSVDLPEFEQLTNQKPSNVQRFTLDFALYRVTSGAGAEPLPLSITPDDYARQIRGMYRAERAEDRLLAWTDGDALLRLPQATGAPLTVAVTLTAGDRPATLAPVEACVALAAEPGFANDDLARAIFAPPTCVTLDDEPQTITLTIAPRSLPPSPTGAILLRITSPTWIPARDDPQGRDPRRLGVQLLDVTMR